LLSKKNNYNGKMKEKKEIGNGQGGSGSIKRESLSA